MMGKVSSNTYVDLQNVSSQCIWRLQLMGTWDVKMGLLKEFLSSRYHGTKTIFLLNIPTYYYRYNISGISALFYCAEL